MSAAAEALPPVSPWRDTSKLDHIPSAAELFAAPPPNEAARAVHDANVATLATQAAWQPRAADEPFTEAERREDLLDEAEGIWSGAFANGWDGNPSDIRLLAAEYQRVERALGWPPEPSEWN